MTTYRTNFQKSVPLDYLVLIVICTLLIFLLSALLIIPVKETPLNRVGLPWASWLGPTQPPGADGVCASHPPAGAGPGGAVPCLSLSGSAPGCGPQTGRRGGFGSGAMILNIRYQRSSPGLMVRGASGLRPRQRTGCQKTSQTMAKSDKKAFPSGGSRMMREHHAAASFSYWRLLGEQINLPNKRTTYIPPTIFQWCAHWENPLRVFRVELSVKTDNSKYGTKRNPLEKVAKSLLRQIYLAKSILMCLISVYFRKPSTPAARSRPLSL